MLSKNNIFNFFIIAFLFWVFLNNLFLNIYITFIGLFFITSLFLNFYIYKRKYFVLYVFVFIWYIIWCLLSSYNLTTIKWNESLLSNYYTKKQEITVKIEWIYTKKEFKNIYKWKLLWIKNNQILENDIFTLLEIPMNFGLEVWDIITYESSLYKIQNIEDFKYKEYMLTKDIYFKSYVNSMTLVSKEKQNILLSSINKFRKTTLWIIKEMYPSEEAIFLWWILIWAREDIPKSLKTDFNNSWLTHFIAVSWFNITILIVFFWFALKFLPVSIRAVLIISFIVIFTIMVWFWAPVIRASIMWIVWYLVLIWGRQNNPLSIILLTAFIMVIVSPMAINYDISFHLSFLAVLWIIYTQDFFNKAFYFLPKTFAIKEAFVLTLAALSFSLPIMVFNFWQVSLLAPIANILVTWTIPIAMLLWFLSIIAYFITPLLWSFIWFFTWLLLKYDIEIVHLFWAFDFAIIKFDFWIYSNYLQVLYFIILIFLINYKKKK